MKEIEELEADDEADEEAAAEEADEEEEVPSTDAVEEEEGENMSVRERSTDSTRCCSRACSFCSSGVSVDQNWSDADVDDDDDDVDEEEDEEDDDGNVEETPCFSDWGATFLCFLGDSALSFSFCSSCSSSSSSLSCSFSTLSSFCCFSFSSSSSSSSSDVPANGSWKRDNEERPRR